MTVGTVVYHLQTQTTAQSAVAISLEHVLLELILSLEMEYAMMSPTLLSACLMVLTAVALTLTMMVFMSMTMNLKWTIAHAQSVVVTVCTYADHDSYLYCSTY